MVSSIKIQCDSLKSFARYCIILMSLCNIVMIKWFVKCDGKVTLSPNHITCLHNHPLADTTVAVLNSVDFQDTNLTFCSCRNSLSVPFRRGWSALFLTMKCTAKQSHKQRKSWKSTYVCSVFQFVGGGSQKCWMHPVQTKVMDNGWKTKAAWLTICCNR